MKMYNLIISGNLDDWLENDNWTLEQNRVFEYTERHLRDKYKNNLQSLTDFPCLFCLEGLDKYGNIGWLRSVIKNGDTVTINYYLDNKFPKFPISSKEEYYQFGVSGFEIYRTHWAVKTGNLFEIAAKIYGNVYKREITVLSNDEMKKIWGDRYKKRKKLVFLSHRASYRKQVSKLAKTLETEGNIKCFVAYDDIQAGSQWSEEIKKALSTMHIFIGIVTDDFHEKSWTDQEIGYSLGRNEISRIFVKIEDLTPRGFVSSEQALSATWENASIEIINHFGDDIL